MIQECVELLQVPDRLKQLKLIEYRIYSDQNFEGASKYLNNDKLVLQALFYRFYQSIDTKELLEFAKLLMNRDKLTRLLLSFRRMTSLKVSHFKQFMLMAESCKNI